MVDRNELAVARLISRIGLSSTPTMTDASHNQASRARPQGISVHIDGLSSSWTHAHEACMTEGSFSRESHENCVVAL